MSDEFETWDAAYVLGALSPQERSRYERHLAECPACREAVASLAGMPGLLVTASAPREPVEPPPPTLLPALLSTVRRRRRRSRTAFGATVLAAAASLIAVLVLVLSPAEPERPARPTRTAMTQTVPGPLSAEAALTTAPWGTRIDVTCRYEEKSGWQEKPRLYTLQVTDRAGHKDQIASWDAIPGQASTIDGLTPMHRSEIASIEINTASGTPILRLRP